MAIEHTWTATMRQNLALIDRCKDPRIRSEYGAVRKEIAHLLVSKKIHYPRTLTALGILDGMSFNEKKQHLGLETRPWELSEPEAQFMEKLKDGAADKHRSEWIFRIGSGSEECHELGWYPFFITLTLDPNRVDKENFWKAPEKGQSEWQKYIRKLSKVVTDELGETPWWKPPYTSAKDYIRYAAVIEHGKSRVHHHVHALVWFREIPSAWKRDPNRGVAHPHARTHRTCRALEALWPYSNPGLSPAIYFRYAGDIWSKMGHVWPYDPKKKQAIKVGGIMSSGAYLAKYLNKDHKEWKHRIKATQGFGMDKLRKFLNQLTIPELDALTWRPLNLNTNLSLNTTHTVPLGLIRSQAKLLSFSKKLASNQLDIQSVLTKTCGPLIGLLKDVKNGINPRRMTSTQFYEWVGQHLPVPKEYCDDALATVHEKVANEFPQVSTRNLQPIAGNKYER